VMYLMIGCSWTARSTYSQTREQIATKECVNEL
jgi:hypothetical protein